MARPSSLSLVMKDSVQRRRRVHRPRRSPTKPECPAAAVVLSHEEVLAGVDGGAADGMSIFAAAGYPPRSPEYPVVPNMDDFVVVDGVDGGLVVAVAAGRRASDETLAVHAGEKLGSGGEARTDSIATPIVSGTTHWFRDLVDLVAFREGRRQSFEYGRYGNPTVKVLEEKISALERAEATLVTSSGMNAIVATLLALVPSGGHVVATTDCYSEARVFIRDRLSKMGITSTFVDLDDMEARGTTTSAAPSVRGQSEEEKAKNGIKDNFVRFSFGIEKFEDLREDILQALEKI
ncbi:cystathionine gamma-synthase 1, chloroplastic-like [Oryza brachyantha]|uniref:Cystathionine gamma-synthase n=1 Tax=Oryza brachyantha TaxID=4533 RepID=J3N2F9_ORYBR|nr:cystathionine gamma-synthase 1, chloroplastic-like [Oryza brachyantha]